MTRHQEPFVRDRGFVFDFVLCLVVTLLTTGPFLVSGTDPTRFVLALLCTLPLMIRRMFPAAAFSVLLVGALGTLAMDGTGAVAAAVAVPIMVYTLARWSGERLARLGLGAAVVGSFLGPARWFLLGRGLGDLALFGLGMVACLAVVLVAYVLGRRRRETLASAQQQEQSEVERTRLVRAEQAQRDRAATVDERNRIARELHDIVAHSLSVIVVQAEGGRALAAKRPEQASVVLGTIADTGREALGEMRRIVGVLRTGGDGDGGEYGPAPGLHDIADLVRRTSDQAELSVFGAPPVVSAALGLSAYRLVQESLTNVLKHAGPDARARVTLAYTVDAVEIEVADDGREPLAPDDGSGHGLRGMAERVALHGGVLSAQPGPAAGWVVRATLPFDPPDGPAGPAPFGWQMVGA